MGGIAEVLSVEEDGDLKIDEGGGDTAIADRFSAPGDDSHPLPGDMVAIDDGPRSGTKQSVASSDELEPVASPGEQRSYAREPAGVLVAEIWQKGDGTIVIRNVAGGATCELTDLGFSCDQEVTARDATPATKVGLSTHQTASPFGPLSVIPGT